MFCKLDNDGNGTLDKNEARRSRQCYFGSIVRIQTVQVVAAFGMLGLSRDAAKTVGVSLDMNQDARPQWEV